MRRIAFALASAALVASAGVVAAPAASPTTPILVETLAPTDGALVSGQTRGDGVWEHLANFPGLASPALTGGGTDLEFFGTGRSQAALRCSFGTLGQDEAGSVGQRLIRLTTERRGRPHVGGRPRLGALRARRAPA